MPSGTVKKLLADKGFGFIDSEQGDLFFHHSALASAEFATLQVGQPVSYEVEDGKNGKGPRAVNIKLGTGN